MKSELKKKPFEITSHYELRKNAYEYFLSKGELTNVAEQLSNLVYNVKILKSRYSLNLEKRVKEFEEFNKIKIKNIEIQNYEI